MSHQQALARVAVSDHMIHRVCFGENQIGHGPKVVIVAVARLGSQGDPFVSAPAQPRVTRHHLPNVNRLAGVVRPAQADNNVVGSLAHGEIVIEIELSGLRPV